MKKIFSQNKENIQFLIIGLGLIGGSIAKKLSKNNYEVLAIDKSKKILEMAKKAKVIRGGQEKIDSKKKLFVILALPPKDLLKIFKEFSNFLDASEFITDCSSVKGDIFKLVKRHNLSSKFILSHPIAGSENSGFINSKENLFKDKISTISKLPGNSSRSLNACKELWDELGATSLVLDYKLHDKIFSLTSHLPHIVAFSLISLFSKRKISQYKNFIGGGLKDFTRIAESDPIMWENIFSLNKKNLLKDINELQNEIDNFKKYISNDDATKLLSHLKKIKKTKKSLNQ